MVRFPAISRALLGCFLTSAALCVCAGQSASSSDPIALAKSDLDKGSYADAEKLLRDHLVVHSTDADACYLLGYTLFRENKPADSLKEYTEAARLRKPVAENLKIVSLDYVLLNDYPDAEHWSKYALSLDPNDAETWYELGRIEYTLNRFQDSLNCFESSLRLDPASVKAENNMGLALEGLNRIDDAITAYRKAIAMQAASLRPSEQPLLNLATLLIDRNQLDEAASLLDQAAHIAPHDWKILAQQGRLRTEKGDLAGAQRALEQAITIEPQRASLHFQLGQVYRKVGAADKAAHEFALVQQLLGTHTAPKN